MSSTVMSVISTTSLHETISQAEALKLTKHVSGQNAQLVRYQFHPYNDDQVGTHFQLLLETKSEDSSKIEQQSLFVKTAPQQNLNEAAYVEEKRLFEHESAFYRDIVPQLMKHVDLGRWIPKCFLAKNDTLVLEDLTTKGYSTRSYVFDEETTKLALRSVARLHASSILAETRLEESLYELYPNAFRETTFTGPEKNHVDAAIAVADSLGLNSSKITAAFDRLQKIVAAERESLSNHETKYKAVSHGGLWATNVKFDSNQPPNCVLIDFQRVHYASHAQDVSLLLHLCTTREFRRQNEQKMVEFYHSNLRTFAYKYNPAARILSIDQLKRETEEQRLRAIVSAVMYLPTTLLTKKFAADLLENPAAYYEFQNGDRRQKIMELMQRDSTYRQRIAEAVEELVNYSDRCC